MMCSEKCKKIELSNIEIDYLKKEIINNNKIIKK